MQPVNNQTHGRPPRHISPDELTSALWCRDLWPISGSAKVKPEASFIHCLILSHQLISACFCCHCPLSSISSDVSALASSFSLEGLENNLFIHLLFVFCILLTPSTHFTDNIIKCLNENCKLWFFQTHTQTALHQSDHDVVDKDCLDNYIIHHCTHTLIYWSCLSLPLDKQFKELTNRLSMIDHSWWSLFQCNCVFIGPLDESSVS